jgi:hypothetical protein
VNWAKDFANFLPEKPFPEQFTVQAPSSIQPRSSCYGRTLSKKDTLVKIFWVVPLSVSIVKAIASPEQPQMFVVGSRRVDSIR